VTGELAALAESIAREAGAALLAAGPGRVSSKSSPNDLVSEADVAAEALIRARIAAARPDDAIMGEEGADTPGTSGLRWVVDPLDGTINYLFGVPIWAVSVAVEDAGGTVAGVVFDPSRDELWAAARDGDATLNGVRVVPSSRAELSSALVATGFGYDEEVRRRQAEVVARLLPAVRDIRRLGAAALDLAWTAGGRYDAFYERGVQRWDVAAGQLICERAGLATRALAPHPPTGPGLLACAPGLADALSAFLR
jgi:myo-inositol-1(or 4)-monophosphatase